jgi:peptidyl-prolyl cis-trans isomerase C
MQSKVFYTFTIGIAVIVSVLTSHPVRAEQTIATVNGKAITQQMFDIYVRQRGVQHAGSMSAEQKDQLINELIDRELLYRKALKEGLNKHPQIAAEVDSATANILAAAVMREAIDAQGPLTDDALKSEYENLKKNLSTQEFKARHILTKTEQDAKEVITELKKGAKFTELAEQKSIGPTAKNGGDLGWFRPDQMVSSFGDAVKTLKKGTYSQTPVKTQYGWHVILLEDIRDVPAPAFDNIKEQIRMRLSNQRLDDYLQQLRSKAKIERK